MKKITIAFMVSILFLLAACKRRACAVTWHEAYSALLNDKLLSLGGGRPNWTFILHDINRDGVPELILFENAPILVNVAAYTFIDGEIRPINYEEAGRPPSGFYATFGDKGVVELRNTPGGRLYRRITLDGDRVVVIYEGSAFITELGRALNRVDNLDVLNTDWYDLTINGEPASSEDFARAFIGYPQERFWPRSFDLTEANIDNIDIIGIELELGIWGKISLPGNLSFNGMDMALIFENPFADILGEPSSVLGNIFFYDNSLQVISDRYPFTPSGMAVQISSPLTNLFEIDGVTLNKPLAELIDVFGDAFNVRRHRTYGYYEVRSNVRIGSQDYDLMFWFNGSLDTMPHMIRVSPSFG